MQEVEDIAVRIRKEGQGVPVVGLRIGKKRHAYALKAGVDSGEIGDREGEVAQSGGIHGGGGLGIGRGFDDFDHGSVGGLDEDGLTVGGLEIDDEIQVFRIPEGEAERIRRRDGNVFDSGDHMSGL